MLGGRRGRSRRQQTADRDARGQCFQSVQGGIIEACGSRQTELPRGLHQNQCRLCEAAVCNYGLADEVCLAIEVLNPAPRQDDAGVGFQFLASAPFALFDGLLEGQFVLEGEQDHAHGCYHRAHRDEPKHHEMEGQDET